MQLKLNFENISRIGQLFHFKQNLLNQAKIYRLLYTKNTKIDTNLMFKIIFQLSILPLANKGNMEYLKYHINIILLQYPCYYNNICTYFLYTKLKYFEDDSYDYRQIKY